MPLCILPLPTKKWFFRMKMGDWGNDLVDKGSISRTYTREGEKQLPRVILSPTRAPWDTCLLKHAHKWMKEWRRNKFKAKTAMIPSCSWWRGREEGKLESPACGPGSLSLCPSTHKRNATQALFHRQTLFIVLTVNLARTHHFTLATGNVLLMSRDSLIFIILEPMIYTLGLYITKTNANSS